MNNKLNDITLVYTDGSCLSNPGGPGGWSAIFKVGTEHKTLKGYELETTNNRMELMAVLQAVKFLHKKGFRNTIISSDSAYVTNAFNKGWIFVWMENDWKTKRGDKVANHDLWQELLELYNLFSNSGKSLFFNKVAGHSGNTYNEIADKAAKSQSEKAKRMLKTIEK